MNILLGLMIVTVSANEDEGFCSKEPESSCQGGIDLLADEGIQKGLSYILTVKQAKSFADFGCGKAAIIKGLRAENIIPDCYDTNPNTSVLTNGLCRYFDLENPV